MRIAFITTMDVEPWGGSEELWSQAAAHLAKTGHQVTASVGHWRTPSPKIAALAKQGVDVRVRAPARVDIVRRVWRKVSPHQPWDWLLDDVPDLVVISQCGFTDGLDCMEFCREKALPYVVIVQVNMEVFWPSDSMSDQMIRAYPAAQKIYCVARHNLRLLERQLGQSLPHAVVAQNPFNVTLNTPLAWPEREMPWRLACVARLDPGGKGQDILFDVLARPEWRDRPIEVNFYGKGLCARGLRRLANYLDMTKIRFHGHADDIDAVWARNHLLLLPSRYEGTPLALMEAMWRGRAAVVTDVGGNAELCVEGETGFVAPAPTPELFAQALERAWNRRYQWQIMGIAARTRAEQILSKDPVGDFARELIKQFGQR